jgi:hypothetical protein
MNTRIGVMSVVFLSVSVFAQPRNFHGFGVIQTRPGVDPSQFIIEVTEGASGMPDQRFSVSPNGRFDLHNLSNGPHTVRVVDQRGHAVGFASIHAGSHSPIEINVSAGVASASAAGPARAVSVESLRADPDGKAEREFRYALWEAKSKNWKAAAKHFDKALQWDERHTPAAANWAAMEVQRGEHVHAEEIARRGLKYAPSNARLLHALGMSLLGQGQLSDEAVAALTSAGKEIPKVLLMAAQAEYLRGNTRQTRELAMAYLEQSNDTEFRAVAERLIKGLPDTSR